MCVSTSSSSSVLRVNNSDLAFINISKYQKQEPFREIQRIFQSLSTQQKGTAFKSASFSTRQFPEHEFQTARKQQCSKPPNALQAQLQSTHMLRLIQACPAPSWKPSHNRVSPISQTYTLSIHTKPKTIFLMQFLKVILTLCRNLSLGFCNNSQAILLL